MTVTAEPSSIAQHGAENAAPAIEHCGLWMVRPSPENDTLYHPVDKDDPAFRDMVESVRQRGILEPILIDVDGWIISGHRRYAAADTAGLDAIPCRRLIDMSREADPDAFVRLLREHNRQREKTLDERTREAIIDVNQDDAYAHLIDYRRSKLDHGQVSGAEVEIGERRGRCTITAAKMPMLQAIRDIIEDNRDYWPLSDRQIHYRLLNNAPLIHASKPASTYRNDIASYRALTDLLTRGRLAGFISWESIGDETRSFTAWSTWREAGAFIREKTGEFLKKYWRDLMQSQPAHVEIIGEKLTVKTIIQRVASDFTIPVTIGRGFCSIQPRYELAQRFKKSARGKLVMLILTDFDPDGEGIAESFARSMRDDFGILADEMQAIKVGLTAEQVKRFRLPRSMKAKESSSRFRAFHEKHGADAWELEALPPETLADELRRAIESVLDLEALEHEREQEAGDARFLEATRKAAIAAIGANQ
jgi:hypothetical protein